MEIVLLTIGKTRADYVQRGIEEYEKRLKRYVSYTLRSLPDVKNAGKMSEAQQKEAEGGVLLNAVNDSDCVILLDERGRQFTSEEFASELQRRMAAGLKRLVYVIGGPYGFSKAVYQRADGMLSLSKMTFNHEMVRMFFTEQVYRAMSILRGEPYHHK